MLIAEAIDVLITLGWWALGWITVIGAALTIVLLAHTARAGIRHIRTRTRKETP